MLIDKKSGVRFRNRKEAKAVMGCIRFEKRFKAGGFVLVNDEGEIDSDKINWKENK